MACISQSAWYDELDANVAEFSLGGTRNDSSCRPDSLDRCAGPGSPPRAPGRKRPWRSPISASWPMKPRAGSADLVRINSVNPPGNEAAVAKYISAIFQKEGISNEVIEMAPGRSIVIARLQAGPLARPGQCSAAGRASGYRRRRCQKMDCGSVRARTFVTATCTAAARSTTRPCSPPTSPRWSQLKRSGARLGARRHFSGHR